MDRLDFLAAYNYALSRDLRFFEDSNTNHHLCFLLSLLKTLKVIYCQRIEGTLRRFFKWDDIQLYAYFVTIYIT